LEGAAPAPAAQKGDGPVELLVVVPTYNEADNLPGLVDRLLELDLDLGVLVVDDGSPDGTGRLADQMAAADPRVSVLHRPGKEGLGRAYVAGFRHALEHSDARLIAQMDADFSHDPDRLPALAAAARTGAVAIGSRYTAGGGVENWGLGRRALSRGGSLYARLVLGLPVRDVTGGFKCWPREALAGLELEHLRAGGYGFQVETTFRAHRAGFPLAEVPIVFVDRRVGQSKMSLGIALEALWLVWSLRLGG
jgi:dolichol-phosphate mannosyltransferase